MNLQAVFVPTPNRPAGRRTDNPPSDTSDLTAVTDSLTRLGARINAIFDSLAVVDDPSQHPGFAYQMRLALSEAAAAPDLLKAEHRIGDPNTYRRHLVMADTEGRYSILALVWGPGQWSPVHAHKTWCGYTVLDGTLEETVYRWNQAEEMSAPEYSHSRSAGAVSFVRAGRQAIHRLGNGGALGTAPAVSLHVYGVRDDRITTHINDLVRTA
jgi:predicted metal-dependent enzyme (double-stranded beta helix superfamily)